MEKSNLDNLYLNKALMLADRCVGQTNLRPSVGCIIVDKNQHIISFGNTQTVKQQSSPKHAEEIAFAKLCKNASNLTLYLTLEPCNYRSIADRRSCLDIILSHKKSIARIVIGMIDPNCQINGKSIAKLSAAGINVEVAKDFEKISKFYEGYSLMHLKHRPKVCLKLATDINGKIGITTKSIWLSNQLATNYSHLLRAKYDAILVGCNTLRVDKPKLNCRLAGLDEASPLKVFLISNHDLLDKIHLDNKSIVFHFDDLQNISTLDNFKAVKEVFVLKRNKDKMFELSEVLQKLASLNISNLLLEGGAKLASNFIKESLIDEIQIITTPNIIRNNVNNLIPALDGNTIANNSIDKYHLDNSFKLGDNVINIYKTK